MQRIPLSFLRRHRAQPTPPLEELRVLEERLARVERRQASLQDSVLAQLQRGDAVDEDLVAALEALRRRVAALEQDGPR